MADVEKEYDFILIDSNPSMNLIHANIACYADYILLPCDMDLMSFSATRSMIHFFQSFEEKSKYKVARILGVIPIRYDRRRNIDNLVKEDLESLEENELLHGGIVFSELRESSNIKTAQAKRKFLSDVFPSGKLTNDCLDVVQEIVNRIKNVKESDKKSNPASVKANGAILKDTTLRQDEYAL